MGRIWFQKRFVWLLLQFENGISCQHLNIRSGHVKIQIFHFLGKKIWSNDNMRKTKTGCKLGAAPFGWGRLSLAPLSTAVAGFSGCSLPVCGGFCICNFFIVVYWVVSTSWWRHISLRILPQSLLLTIWIYKDLGTHKKRQNYYV